LAQKKKKAKKRVNHNRKEEANNGASAIPDENASGEAVRDILNRMFDGSAEELAKSLAESNQLTPQELARMKEIFGRPDARKGERTKSRTSKKTRAGAREL
jgi:predicted transcriptional regulator